MKTLVCSWLAVVLLALSGLLWLPQDSSNFDAIGIAKTQSAICSSLDTVWTCTV